MRATRLVWTFAALVACGGSTSPATTDGGGAATTDSSPGGQPPDAFVSALVGTGTATPPNACSLGPMVGFLAIGVAENGRPLTVQDGQSLDGEAVHVACSVMPAGGGFDISLSVSWADPYGGSLVVASPSGLGAVTASGGTGLTATFVSTSLGTYQASECTLAFTYGGSPVPSVPPVAPGRIWGHVSCPQATASGGSNGQCDAEADFLFEQCSQ